MLVTVVSCLLYISITSVECQAIDDYYRPVPRFTCRRECTDVGSCATETKDNLVCRCDGDCAVYGDCCANSTEFCIAEDQSAPLDGLLECRSIHLDARTKPNWMESFWMVSSCPSDWLAGRDDQLLLDTLNNCTSGSNDLPPVTDLETGLVFKNEYCAVCHEVETFIQWGYRLECSPALRVMAQSPDFQVTAEIVERECLTCAFRSPPQLTPSPRACLHDSLVNDFCLEREELESMTGVPISEQLYQELVSQCQSGHVGPLVLGYPQEFRPFSFFITDEVLYNEFPFRNQFCALCNGIRVSYETMTCVDPYLVRNSTNYCRQTAANIMTPQPSPSPQPPPPKPDFDDGNRTIVVETEAFFIEQDPVSFTIFVDVNGDSQVVRIENRTVNIPVSCEVGQVFDPVNQKCRDTICPESARGEPCAIINDLSLIGVTPNTTENISLQCDLEKIIFLNMTSDEFVVFDNETVMFGEEIFDIIGYINDSVAICTNFSQNGTIVENITVFIYSYPAAFSIVTYIGCSLSVIGCTIVLLTYSIFKELRTLPGKILMNLAAAIFATCVFIMIGVPLFSLSEKEELCQTTAIILHWVVLSQFSWMTIISYELARTMIRATKLQQVDSENVKRRRFLLYMLIGWGLPTAITGLSTIINYTTDYIRYGEEVCWIGHTESFYIVFLVPVALSIVMNGILFFVTSYLLFKAQRGGAKLQKQKTNSYFRIYLSVFSITGLTWTFGFVAILARSDWASYLFILLTSTQGFIICVAFLFTQKVGTLYKQCFWPKITATFSFISFGKQPVQDTSMAVRYVRKHQTVSTEYTSANGSEVEHTKTALESNGQKTEERLDGNPTHYANNTDTEHGIE